MEGKKITNILLIIAAIILAVFVFIAVKHAYTNTNNNKVPDNSFSWQIKNTGNISEVYLVGQGAENVSAVEVKLNFDSNYLKFKSVASGGFFQNPLQVKWDDITGLFSLIQNPENDTLSDPNLPVLIIETEISQNTNLTIDPSSQIYVRNTGGFTPKDADVLLEK